MTRSHLSSSPVHSSYLHLIEEEEESNASSAPVYLGEGNVLSAISLHWVQYFISLGANKVLTSTDIPPLSESEQCAHLSLHYHQHQTTPARRLMRTISALSLINLIGFLLYTALMAGQPFLVKEILHYLSDTSDSSSGYVNVLLLVLTSLLSVFTLNYGYFMGSKAGCQIRSLVMTLLYEKILTLSTSSGSEGTNNNKNKTLNSGEILTLMAVDCERLFEAVCNLHWILVAPLAIFLSLLLIGAYFDWVAALVGGVVALAILLISLRVAIHIGKIRHALVAVTEERVNLSCEILSGVRILKFYGWEKPMQERVNTLRQHEVTLLIQFHWWRVFNMSFLILAPVFIGGVIFVLILLQEVNTMDVTQLYTLLAFVNISRLGINVFPVAAAAVMEARISMQRIDEFLNLPPLDNKIEHSTEGEQSVIVLANASFQWPSCSNTILWHLNVRIRRGSLTMVIGPVGSGKSSFLQAILGEMSLVEGSCKSANNQTVAYVNQEPWIRHQTIQQNIVLVEDSNKIDHEWYDHVLQVTQLKPDLARMPRGDQTLIGERGLNLSGGQKARLSLARSLYLRQSPLLLLDDPLSALDVHVARAIFEQALIPNNSTRILVLNSHYQFLRKADRIIVFEQGEIVGDGDFKMINESFPHYLSLDNSSAEEKQKKEKKKIVQQRSSSICSSSIILEELREEEEKEGRETGSVSWLIYCQYFQNSGLNGTLVIGILVSLFALGQLGRVSCDWWMAEWAEQESLFHQFPNVDRKWNFYGLMFLGIVVLAGVITLGRCYVFFLVMVKCALNLHHRVFHRVLSAPITTFYDVTPLGRIFNRFSRDLDQIDTMLPDFALHLLTQFCVIISVLLICLFSSYYIALAYLPILAVFYITGKYFEKTSRELKRLEGISRSPLFSLFTETFAGLDTIRAFKLQSYFLTKVQQAIDENSRFYFLYWAAERWLSLRLDLLSVGLIAIVASVLVATRDSISAELAGLTLTYCLMLTSVLQWCVRVWNSTENCMTSVERISHYANIPIEEEQETTTMSNWTPSEGGIEIDGLQLRYRPDCDLVLHGINLSIEGGSKVGVCGRTGAGKSSLMVALFRITEYDQGTIYIDGQDISQLSLEVLRRNISIIPQDPVLFSGSLRENLDPFNLVSDETIWQALKKIQMDTFIKRQSDGDFNRFVVSERGENLSLGQRQLICIARALIRQSKIIVMDEATASVDKETDSLIQLTIRKEFSTQTILTIAHRLETIMDSDKILVLCQGKVGEYDKPANLLTKENGLFRAMAANAGLV